MAENGVFTHSGGMWRLASFKDGDVTIFEAFLKQTFVTFHLFFRSCERLGDSSVFAGHPKRNPRFSGNAPKGKREGG